MYQQLLSAYDKLRPYWEIQDNFEEQYPRYLQMKEDIARNEAYGGDFAEARRLRQSSYYRSAEEEITRRKAQMRIDDKLIAALLRFWGYRTSDKMTTEGRDLWRRMERGEVDSYDDVSSAPTMGIAPISFNP
tara:strand:- start:135 stop:530 length:396 start_codon:yes stop_codon:yes gene_type:complete